MQRGWCLCQFAKCASPCGSLCEFVTEPCLEACWGKARVTARQGQRCVFTGPTKVEVRIKAPVNISTTKKQPLIETQNTQLLERKLRQRAQQCTHLLIVQLHNHKHVPADGSQQKVIWGDQFGDQNSDPSRTLA